MIKRGLKKFYAALLTGIMAVSSMVYVPVAKASEETGFYSDEEVINDEVLEEDENALYAIDADQAVWDVLDIVNEERAKQGLPELVMDASLVNTANIRAQEIVTKFDHERPDGSSCFTAFDDDVFWWACGENIAAGQGSAASVMNAWMNSPGHRANILESGYNCIGIALVYNPNAEYRYYWVQVFGYRDNPEKMFRDGSVHSYIKGICQMPNPDGTGGYLIGIESYDNPNNSYQYEMLILDCTLYAQGKPAWIYSTGKCGAPGNCLWTIWKPKYGYYWTLFRIFDKNGNMLDEACFGFVNAY